MLAIITTAAHAQYHQSYEATTKGLDLVDGALACQDYNTTRYLYGKINEARHFQRALPKSLIRQAEIVGTKPSEPVPAEYGCILVPPGTSVHVESDYGIPVISGRLHGTKFTGVTLPYMLSHKP